MEKLEKIMDTQLDLWMLFQSQKPMKISEFCMMLKEDLFWRKFHQLKANLNFAKLKQKKLDQIKSHMSSLMTEEPSDSQTQKWK